MEEILSNSYSEVSQILDVLGNSYKNKIPAKILRLIEENRNDSYKPDIDNDFNFSRTTLIIISILNLKYWESDLNKIQKLKNIYYINELKYQEKINSYQNADWLNKKITVNINTECNTDTSLILEKKESIWNKIKNIIYKIIHK